MAIAGAPRRDRRELIPARVSGKDLMHLSRQLAAFLRAGIPILDGLDVLGREASNPTMRRTLADVADALRQGEPLAEAFDRHPKVFPAAYRSMIHSAELTGSLDSVLDRLTVYVERDVESRSRIRSALAYPAVIVVLSIAVSVLLVVFVLPKFQVFFAAFHQQLPLTTRILLGVSQFTHRWWWALLGGAAVLGVGGFLLARTPAGRAVVERAALRLPLIGDALRFSVVERFARVLSAMMRAGVPVGDAMEVAAAATNSPFATARLLIAREAMLSGEGMTPPLAASGVFPPAATQMLRVGEDTGSLDEQLDAVAGFYERELDYKVKHILTMLEPAVLIVMGVMVGFVALALVSAMYGIYSHAGT